MSALDRLKWRCDAYTRSPTTKVFHSFGDFVRANGVQSGTVTKAQDVLNVAASVATAATLSGATALSAGLVIPAIGLVSIAYQAYSDRETAHQVLSSHTHDPFLTQPFRDSPEVRRAAYTLLKDGLDHIALQESKLQMVQQVFAGWLEQVRYAVRVVATGTPGDEGRYRMAGFVEDLVLGRLAEPLLEWVRRHRHASNYRQALYLLAQHDLSRDDIHRHGETRRMFQEIVGYLQDATRVKDECEAHWRHFAPSLVQHLAAVRQRGFQTSQQLQAHAQFNAVLTLKGFMSPSEAANVYQWFPQLPAAPMHPNYRR